jgi:hypothetical protein
LNRRLAILVPNQKITTHSPAQLSNIPLAGSEELSKREKRPALNSVLRM